MNTTRPTSVSDQMTTRVSNILDKVKSAAASDSSYRVYGMAAFFAMLGYAVWGAADSRGRHG